MKTDNHALLAVLLMSPLFAACGVEAVAPTEGAANGLPATIPDSGQRFCFDAATAIDCPSEGAAS